MSHRFSIWDEWKSWTRFMALVDYSLETSATLWKALPIKERENVTLQRSYGGSSFACPGKHFLPILEDRHTISTLLLLSSYALIEGHVDEVVTHMVTEGVTSVPLVNDIRAGTTSVLEIISIGGIESWGTRLLSELGRDWSSVLDDKGGMVEVATVRNALAHGARNVQQSMINRVSASGGTLPWALNSPIQLDLRLTRLYRHRLRSFARVISHAAIERV